MASARAFQPLLRSAAPRLAIRRSVQRETQRFLNIETSPAIYTAHASVSGGRAGKVHAQNLDTQLSMPTELGGKGGGTNPEELFAAGYGACFQGAMNAVAPSLKIKVPENAVIETKVHLIGSAKDLDFGIRVDMLLKVPKGAEGVKKEELEKLVEKTKGVCPYSRATEGNVITNVKVEVE